MVNFKSFIHLKMSYDFRKCLVLVYVKHCTKLYMEVMVCFQDCDFSF